MSYLMAHSPQIPLQRMIVDLPSEKYYRKRATVRTTGSYSGNYGDPTTARSTPPPYTYRNLGDTYCAICFFSVLCATRKTPKVQWHTKNWVKNDPIFSE